jgi:hypothetical protein
MKFQKPAQSVVYIAYPGRIQRFTDGFYIISGVRPSYCSYGRMMIRKRRLTKFDCGAPVDAGS